MALPALPRPDGVRRAAAALLGALRARVGKRRAAPTAPAPRALRPVIVPGALSELHGPASGVVELPQQRLCWSLLGRAAPVRPGRPAPGARLLRVRDRRGPHLPADLTDWLDAGLLSISVGTAGHGPGEAAGVGVRAALAGRPPRGRLMLPLHQDVARIVLEASAGRAALAALGGGNAAGTRGVKPDDRGHRRVRRQP